MNQDPNLALPLSETAQAEPLPENVSKLALDREENLYLDGARVDLGDLAVAIRKKAIGTPDLAVVVEIHRELPVQRLVELMDKLTEAGVKKTSVVASGGKGVETKF